MSLEKTLDAKLRSIHADPFGSREFILADAKDPEMAFGIAAPGMLRNGDQELRYRTLAEFRDQIRRIVKQGIVDIMLMSASTCDELATHERLFVDSPVTPAARANDTSDIHLPRGGRYHKEPSRPFRSASIDHIQYGRLDASPQDRKSADLGLYSITFNNDLTRDLESIQAYKDFREEAERKGFRHFLEVFDPNYPGAVEPDKVGSFVNDMIARTLAGVTRSARPLFLKMAYHGPRSTEELVQYDPHLIIGILGGSSGTTLDAFTLLHQAQKYGARAALFGRKINNAEDQLLFIEFLHRISNGDVEPDEAVKAYHGELSNRGIRPQRPLEKDLVLESNVMHYAGSSTTISVPLASN